MTDKTSNDFRAAFNAFVENQREVRSSMFELFAMEAGVEGGAEQIRYWGDRSARLRQPRSRLVRLHYNLFASPWTAYHAAREGKRPRKQKMKRDHRVIVRHAHLATPNPDNEQ